MYVHLHIVNGKNVQNSSRTMSRRSVVSPSSWEHFMAYKSYKTVVELLLLLLFFFFLQHVKIMSDIGFFVIEKTVALF